MRFLAVLFLVTGLLAPVRAEESVVWVSTDFTSGGLAVQEAGSCDITEQVSPVSGDPVIRSYHGNVYVINRLGYDNVTVFQPPDFNTPIVQFSTGNGTNPQDIYVVGEGKAYVTLFEQPELLIVHPGTGESLGTIDLAYAADADGIPEMTHIVPFGDMIMILCQRLDRTTEYMDPSGPGCIAIIDPATDTPYDVNDGTVEVDPLELPLANPADWAATSGGVVISCTGFWSNYGDGGIVEVTGFADEVPIVAVESDIAVDFSGIASCAGYIYVVGSDVSWTNSINIIDESNHEIVGTLGGISGGYIPFIMGHDRMLYVADQGTWTNPELAGVLVFDCEDNSLYCGPASTGLPPVSAAVVKALGGDMDNSLTDVHALAVVYPNPAGKAINIRALLPDAPLSRVQIFDMSGRVRETAIFDTPVEGVHMDIESHSLPSGQYVVRYYSGFRTGESIIVVHE